MSLFTEAMGKFPKKSVSLKIYDHFTIDWLLSLTSGNLEIIK